jgi:hypothetical protein
MEIGDLIVRILEVIAWPITIIVIVLVFKGQLGRIILSLSKLRFKDIEVEFGKELKDAESIAKELRLPKPAEVRRVKEPLTITPVYDRLRQVAEISPRAAVTEAWMIVEAATTEAARAQGIKAIRARTGREAIHDLAEKTRLQEGTIELYDYLRRMRNNAAHSFEFEINYKDVIRYIDLALSLAHRLRTPVNE